ncbi:MAG: iron-siderophore ABC transporter substrate-binding protein [Nostoc sp.]|uniref:iron-siderophore ABC transporter substrate-binding protein n=1 Tax=Nostoc sp. TaxID=1180 RepID=UPI002FF3123E
MKTILLLQKSKLAQLYIIAILLLVSLAACNLWRHVQNPSTFAPPADVHIVKHAMGTTAVPQHPQRFVSLHAYATEAAIALGVKLIGTTKKLAPQLKLDDIVDIGLPPNIEKVLALKPDLLIGNMGAGGTEPESYRLWSDIAPTVFFDMRAIADWKRPFLVVAEALGKTEQAKQVVAQYNARIAQFKARMGDKLKQTRVSVVDLYAGTIIVRIQKSFSGSILKEVGLDIPQTQKLSPTIITKLSGNTALYSISPEFLSLIDGDVLFLMTSSFPTKADSELAIQQFMAQPLWSKLKVAQQGKVHVIGPHWGGGNYLSANRVLDDLFKYLLSQ